MRSFVEEQIARRRYSTTSEYVRELIPRDQDREHLRELLLAGASSEPGPVADGAYFDGLRGEIETHTNG